MHRFYLFVIFVCVCVFLFLRGIVAVGGCVALGGAHASAPSGAASAIDQKECRTHKTGLRFFLVFNLLGRITEYLSVSDLRLFFFSTRPRALGKAACAVSFSIRHKLTFFPTFAGDVHRQMEGEKRKLGNILLLQLDWGV